MYKIKFKDGSVKEFESLRGQDLSYADLSYANLSNANLYNANLYNANLSYANLSYANLNNANLNNANLSNASLNNANLIYANLYNANLSYANLYNANLNNAKGIITFQASRHLAIAFTYEVVTYIKIGCITKTSEEWLKEYKKIGIKTEYSKMEIKAYGSFIKFINENKDELFSSEQGEEE